jgi:hypothetical protein
MIRRLKKKVLRRNIMEIMSNLMEIKLSNPEDHKESNQVPSMDYKICLVKDKYYFSVPMVKVKEKPSQVEKKAHIFMNGADKSYWNRAVFYHTPELGEIGVVDFLQHLTKS